eukprot:366172-Chlamydomonas_euryale.AAC.3
MNGGCLGVLGEDVWKVRGWPSIHCVDHERRLPGRPRGGRVEGTWVAKHSLCGLWAEAAWASSGRTCGRYVGGQAFIVWTVDGGCMGVLGEDVWKVRGWPSIHCVERRRGLPGHPRGGRVQGTWVAKHSLCGLWAEADLG